MLMGFSLALPLSVTRMQNIPANVVGKYLARPIGCVVGLKINKAILEFEGEDLAEANLRQRDDVFI